MNLEFDPYFLSRYEDMCISEDYTLTLYYTELKIRLCAATFLHAQYCKEIY